MKNFMINQLATNNLPNLNPKIVLGIAAHPDDLDVIAGGALAKFAENGAEIHFLILTDGSKGSDDPNATSEYLKQVRYDEQKAALDVIGGKTINFLHYTDGELEITIELKKQISRSIRQIKPDVIVTMDPTVVYSLQYGRINHPDHRAAGQATLDAVFPLARDRLTFPELLEEGLEPHKTTTILLNNMNESNYFVDISDTIDKKIEAIKTHVSQFGDDPDLSWAKAIATADGAKAGFEYAEGFVRIDIG